MGRRVEEIATLLNGEGHPMPSVLKHPQVGWNKKKILPAKFKHEIHSQTTIYGPQNINSSKIQPKHYSRRLEHAFYVAGCWSAGEHKTFKVS